MSTNGKKKNEQLKNSSEKDTNINSNNQKINFQESPNTDNEEKDKPVHFKIEYDKNKNFEYQIESLPEVNEVKIQPENHNSSSKKEKEFIIEKNNQTNEKQNNLENKQNNQYYDLLNVDNNFDDYYYYINNNNNEKNNEEEEEEPRRVINFATKTYQGRIDPVKLKQRYNNYWQNQSKSRQKYKQKMDALKKVFNPYGYKNVVNKYKRRVSSQYNTRRTLNDNDRPNTKQPLPKQSYLEVPYDYGINDPNYGKENPNNYDRKKMIKLRMLKQPLKYYYPYTNENLINKKGFKYQ